MNSFWQLSFWLVNKRTFQTQGMQKPQPSYSLKPSISTQQHTLWPRFIGQLESLSAIPIGLLWSCSGFFFQLTKQPGGFPPPPWVAPQGRLERRGRVSGIPFPGPLLIGLVVQCARPFRHQALGRLNPDFSVLPVCKANCGEEISGLACCRGAGSWA